MTVANTKHVEYSLDQIRALFIKASEAIEALAPGGKIPATALAEKIGKEIDIAGPQLYPTLKFLFNGYPGVKILRGAHGGIYKLTDAELAKLNPTPVVAAPVAPVVTAVGDTVSEASIISELSVTPSAAEIVTVTNPLDESVVQA